LTVGRESSRSAGDALGGRSACLAGSTAGRAPVVAVEELSAGAVDLPEYQSLADPEAVHVEAGGTGTAVDGGIEDGIEGTGGAGALEGELILGAGEEADATAIAIVPQGADTASIGYDLVIAAGVAVALAVQQLVVLALAHAERSLSDLTSGTGAHISLVDQVARADRADPVDEEPTRKRGTGGADLSRVVGESILANASAVNQDLVDLTAGAGPAVGGGRGPRGTDLACSVDPAQSLKTGAGLGGGIVDLVCSAFPGADAPLVGEETRQAVAVLGG